MDVIEKYKETRSVLFKKAGISPDSKIISTNGPVKNVHYLDLGNGEPLIVIHGGLSHSSQWINILKPLSEHFHLYVLDRPGHGLSDSLDYSKVDYRRCAVKFVHSFMESVGLDKAHLLGNSMGSYFSICFGLEHPDKVGKMVLLGAPAGMNLWVPLMPRLLGVKLLNRLLLKTVAKPSISGLKMIHKRILVAKPENLDNDYYAHAYYNMLLPGAVASRRSMLESVFTIGGWRKDLFLGDQLNRLSGPVYFIWGDQDAYERPDTGIKKASGIANHVFKVVENAGHCPWFDQPQQCTALIIEMLTT